MGRALQSEDEYQALKMLKSVFCGTTWPPRGLALGVVNIGSQLINLAGDETCQQTVSRLALPLTCIHVKHWHGRWVVHLVGAKWVVSCGIWLYGLACMTLTQ